MKKIILLFIVLGLFLIFLPQALADLDEGLVGYWPFNGNANDESGNGNHGTVHGSTLVEDRYGNLNGAYSFDGMDDYIEVSSFSSLSFTEITISAWVKTALDWINNRRIVTIDDGLDSEYHYFDIESHSGRGIEVFIDQESVGTSGWEFEHDIWTQITVTYDGTNVEIYINGQKTATGLRNASSRSGVLYIGGVDSPSGSARIWDGEIDDVRIYNRALSEAEIKMLSRIKNPENGHWYQRFDNSLGWHDAKDYCESMGGYLATIASQAENDFVYNNLASFSPHEMVWLGATDETQEGTWEWVTGESWNFTNWDSGEPNNCSDIEHYLVYFTPNDPLGRAGLWNDLGEGNNGGCGCGGCINEWYPMSTICEWDNSVAFNPNNGHYYQLVKVQDHGLNWYEAKDEAEAMEHSGMRGHLATLTGADEEKFVAKNFPQIVPNYVWLGATDKEIEDDWNWITGEEWSYTNWDQAEPNGGAFENCLDYSDGVDKWNDESCSRKLNYYLVEYSHIDARIKIIPKVLNLKSRGKSIISGIRLPKEYDPKDIARDSLELSIPASPDGGVIFSNWEFPLRRRFIAFFPRQDLIDELKTMNLELPTKLDLKITGELNDGTPFEGLDTIRIIKRNKWKKWKKCTRRN